MVMADTDELRNPYAKWLMKAAVEIQRLTDALAEAEKRIAELRRRLENDAVWRANVVTGELELIKMDLPEYMDGIACRDETISGLQDQLSTARSEGAADMQRRCDDALMVAGEKLGAVDGYDYRSGQEAAFREARFLIAALPLIETKEPK